MSEKYDVLLKCTTFVFYSDESPELSPFSAMLKKKPRLVNSYIIMKHDTKLIAIHRGQPVPESPLSSHLKRLVNILVIIQFFTLYNICLISNYIQLISFVIKKCNHSEGKLALAFSLRQYRILIFLWKFSSVHFALQWNNCLCQRWLV